jgi:hypothetical protein
LDGQAKMGRRMRGIAEQDQAKKGVKIKWRAPGKQPQIPSNVSLYPLHKWT